MKEGMNKFPKIWTIAFLVGILFLSWNIASLKSGPFDFLSARFKQYYGVCRNIETQNSLHSEGDYVEEYSEKKHKLELAETTNESVSKEEPELLFRNTALSLPKHMPSGIAMAASLIEFVAKINNALNNINNLIKEEDFVISEWNMFRQAIVKMPKAPVTWSIYLNGPNGAVSGVKKMVYNNMRREKEIKHQGYSISFYKGARIISRVRRNDGCEYILFSPDGTISDYARKVEGYTWYSIRWDEDGNILSEETRGPSRRVMDARIKFIEKYKNDPNKAEAVRQLQEEVDQMKRVLENEEEEILKAKHTCPK